MKREELGKNLGKQHSVYFGGRDPQKELKKELVPLVRKTRRVWSSES